MIRVVAIAELRWPVLVAAIAELELGSNFEPVVLLWERRSLVRLVLKLQVLIVENRKHSRNLIALDSLIVPKLGRLNQIVAVANMVAVVALRLGIAIVFAEIADIVVGIVLGLASAAGIEASDIENSKTGNRPLVLIGTVVCAAAVADTAAAAVVPVKIDIVKAIVLFALGPEVAPTAMPVAAFAVGSTDPPAVVFVLAQIVVVDNLEVESAVGHILAVGVVAAGSTW